MDNNTNTGPVIPPSDEIMSSGGVGPVEDASVVDTEGLPAAVVDVLGDSGITSDMVGAVANLEAAAVQEDVAAAADRLPTKSRPVVEVYDTHNNERHAELVKLIQDVPDLADSRILANALYGFDLTTSDIMHPIEDYEGSEDERAALKQRIGAGMNNSLITLERMQGELAEGMDIFATPQYIRLQIPGGTSDRIVYVSISDEKSLNQMAQSLDSHLKALNTDKRTWILDKNYRNNYGNVSIKPELVSIMDQDALDREMSGGDLSESLIVKSVQDEGPSSAEQEVPVTEDPKEDVDSADEQQGTDYNQPLEWEISDEEVVANGSLSVELGYYIRIIGDLDGGSLPSMRNKEDLEAAISLIRGYLKYANSVPANDVQFLRGGMLCKPRLEGELRRLRRLHDLGEQVTDTSKAWGGTTEMRITGTESIPEIYGYEVFNPEGKPLEEIVKEWIVGIPFTSDYDVAEFLGENNQADAAINQLVEFIARPGVPIGPVLELIKGSDDIKEEDVPRLLQTIGNYNIKPSDFGRVANMIIDLKYIVDTKDRQANAANPPL